ncbi:hypothetical protein L1049_011246 [Liquidambar formosana]|uniref:Box C/D snoRNA protein 1 n=1 Tax=Liquidambar formosana TaxID=63359 RepID=A0AAP0RRJ6_LIQFO
MEEKEQTTQTPKQSPLCEECKSNPSKYKCPGCSLRSCGLACVKAHKQRTRCTGKRLQTQFVPLSQFDDNILLSDYNLLEEVKRVSESAQRMRVKLCGYSHFKLPFHLQSLRKAASHRRMKLLFLPQGMSKRAKNQSRYDQRKKFISWTIEWRFHSTDVVILDHGVHENTTLCSVIEKHLKAGPWNHQLRQFCEEHLDCLKFFIRKYPKGPKSPFRELDIKAPISQQLANLVILEYPVIHVFLPSHGYDFEVLKDSNPRLHKTELKDYVNNDHPSPEVVPFKEEEIEEDGSTPDPRVLDLIKHVKPDNVFQSPHQGSTGKELYNSSDGPLLERIVEGTKPVVADNDILIHRAEDGETYSSSKIKELGFLEDMDFDFEQGLIDAYSDLIAETNPDDFLDFEGGFVKEVESRDQLDFSAVFPVDELEEGEIGPE